MADEPENLILRMLREMRTEMREYAYPHREGIAWGVNTAGSGVNVIRGIRRPDGTDKPVS